MQLHQAVAKGLGHAGHLLRRPDAVTRAEKVGPTTAIAVAGAENLEAPAIEVQLRMRATVAALEAGR